MNRFSTNKSIWWHNAVQLSMQSIDSINKMLWIHDMNPLYMEFTRIITINSIIKRQWYNINNKYNWKMIRHVLFRFCFFFSRVWYLPYILCFFHTIISIFLFKLIKRNTIIYLKILKMNTKRQSRRTKKKLNEAVSKPLSGINYDIVRFLT